MLLREQREIPVAGEYDVIVCGGGFGGISAALAAAREGSRVLLLERQFLLGGLGTAGLVTIYLPLCDGYGRQISFGLAEEWLRLSISMGAEARYPANWLDGVGSRTEKDKRFEVQYNPQLFAILAEKALLDAGVEILYGTYAVGVQMEGDRIRYVLTESKSGREAYGAKSVVDATGDCDIAHFAGAPTARFQQGNVPAAWYYFCGQNGYGLQMLGYSDTPVEERKPDFVSKALSSRRYSGLDAREVSEFTIFGHDALLRDLKGKREQDPERVPVTIATVPQLRMTRRIAGAYELCYDEEHTYFEDSIGMVSNWKKRGPVWEVPFRTLYCEQVKNLLVAGRCTSVNERLWDVMRVIPCCAVTGQAAGIAAAMSDDMRALDVSALQARLVRQGVVLHEADL